MMKTHSILVWAICLYVENHVQEKNDWEDLVSCTGFSLAHIRDVFHKQTGKTLSRYIQERKIANAAQELLCTDKEILEVALSYGYSGRDVFSRTFRRYTGYTPSEFRQVQPGLKKVKLGAGVIGIALPQKEGETHK